MMLTIRLKDGREVAGDYTGLELLNRLLWAETSADVADIELGVQT